MCTLRLIPQPVTRILPAPFTDQNPLVDQFPDQGRITEGVFPVENCIQQGLSDGRWWIIQSLLFVHENYIMKAGINTYCQGLAAQSEIN